MKVWSFASVSLALFSGILIAETALRAQDAAVTNPATAKVEFENEQIRLLRVSIGPHQKGAVHSHPGRLGVTITRNDVRVYFPDGTSKTSVRGAHEYFWGEPVTHQVANLSDDAMQNIEIELKRAGVGSAEQAGARFAAGESTAQGTAADPVAVEQEPHHRLVFENPFVRVLDVVVKPGDTTLFHRHSLDNVAVTLSDATINRQSAGEEWVASPAKEGFVGFLAGTKTPYVHRITNTGTTVFHVLDVEILP